MFIYDKALHARKSDSNHTELTVSSCCLSEMKLQTNLSASKYQVSINKGKKTLSKVRKANKRRVKNRMHEYDAVNW